MALLTVTNLALGIGARTFCNGLALSVHAGERWAVIGPNGAGKSTLMRTLAGLAPPRAGSIVLGTRDVRTLPARTRAQAVALLPQADDDSFPATVLETVLLARHPHVAWSHWESAADHAVAHDALRAFGVDGLAARDVRSLSGGERRRVALAALVAQQAPVMLLDEPSSHLDVGQQSHALDALSAHSARAGAAVVMVLHDLHLAARYCDHVIAIGDGVAVTGTTQALLTAPRLSTLFARPLVELRDGPLRAFVPR